MNVAILTQREESLLAAREPGYERISDFGIRHDNPGSDAVVKKRGRHWQLPGSSEEQVVGTGCIIKDYNEPPGLSTVLFVSQYHTALNQKLSKSRAASVVAWLTGRGVAPARLTSRSYGKPFRLQTMTMTPAAPRTAASRSPNPAARPNTDPSSPLKAVINGATIGRSAGRVTPPNALGDKSARRASTL